MRALHLVVSAVLLSVLAAHADEVVLNNGNRLTGTIVKLADKKLELKTDFAGTIDIKWDAVKSVTAEAPLVISTASGKLSAREITRNGGEFVVADTTGSTTQIPSANLQNLRSQAEQGAYEHSLHPGWREDWAGGANMGLALARGNSSTVNLSLGMNLTRPTLNDKTSLYATSVYAKDNLRNTVTANAIQSGVRYDHNIRKKWFAYGSADFETNDLQDLNLRSILGGGLGWHAVDSPTTSLNFLAGVAWTRESYSTGLKNNIFSPSFGEDFNRKLSANTVFTQHASFLPYVTGAAAGNYRFALDAGLSTKISRLLAWQTTVTDRYVSNPLPGTKGNDLLLSTGLAFTLAGAK